METLEPWHNASGNVKSNRTMENSNFSKSNYGMILPYDQQNGSI